MLAMAMLFTLAVTAFAAEGELGSITINGVSDKNTYEIYRLLDLQSYDKESGAYSYTVNSAWSTFFATDEANAYFAVDEQNYATWIAASDDDETVAAFAKIALQYAKDNNIDPVKSSDTEGAFVITTNEETEVTSGVFSDLTLGYYLVDSTVGALCGLTTTNPDASINAKNGIPVVDKQVIEDSTNNPGPSNTADIGQIVEFQTIITVHAGAENYVLHDKMSAGLTFQKITKVEHVVPGDNAHEAVSGTDYTVVTKDLHEGCTFEVHFTKAFCDHLETNDKIIVHYTAMLNRHALVAGDGNPNETWLDFGEENETNHDTTKTYTFGIDIVKTDGQNNLIDGAEFRIYDAAEGGNEIGVVPLLDADEKPVMDENGNPMYRRARPDEQTDGKTVNIVVKDGLVTVVGFDNGTYYLQEVVTPAGYNQLAARQRFIIADGNLDSVFNGDIYSTGSGVHVVNKSGTMLPETGGMGTKMFITFGAVVVLGAGALLVTKKRMGMIED